MSELVLGIVFLLIAALLLFLGVRYRRNSYACYAEDSQRCTATTTLTVTDVDKQEEEQWEDRDDGSLGAAILLVVGVVRLYDAIYWLI